MGKHITIKHLTLFERERIGVYRAQGKTGREIARLLNRSHTTINRELKRNREPHPMMKGYIGCLAHQQSIARKKDAGKRPRLKHECIRTYVEEKLQIGWSPEQIAHRLGIDYPGSHISHEAIYQYIYSDLRVGIQYLARRHPKRYARDRIRKRHKPAILNRVDITLRPAVINERKEGGHWESDSVESDQSLVSINVLYERVSRLLKLTLMANKKAETNKTAIISQLKNLPLEARKSLTYDNGPENYLHEEINHLLGTQSYFCQPYHSWEKGGVENSNGLLRRFLPKKTDLGSITQEELNSIEMLLNNRPRKCLGFKTPNEVFINLYGAVPY
jgi:IS30 family transposase